MKKQILLAIGIFLMAFQSFSQQTKSEDKENTIGRNSFFAEVGGPGVLFSVNFDRRFHASNYGVGGRIGVGFVTVFDDRYDTLGGNFYYTNGRQRSVITVPLQINYVFGSPDSRHTLEVGAGFTFISRKIDVFNTFYDNQPTDFYGTFSFMYRKQPKNGGFSWRIGFTPLISKSYIQASGGLSLGYNF